MVIGRRDISNVYKDYSGFNNVFKNTSNLSAYDLKCVSFSCKVQNKGDTLLLANGFHEHQHFGKYMNESTKKA